MKLWENAFVENTQQGAPDSQAGATSELIEGKTWTSDDRHAAPSHVIFIYIHIVPTEHLIFKEESIFSLHALIVLGRPNPDAIMKGYS